MAETRRVQKPAFLETDLPKILKPVDLGGMYAGKLQIDMDCTDDRVMGLASGLHVTYPHRDYGFVARFDEPFLNERAGQRERNKKLQQWRWRALARSTSKPSDAEDEDHDSIRYGERLQPDEEDAAREHPETYASIFVEYMNLFGFE